MVRFNPTITGTFCPTADMIEEGMTLNDSETGGCPAIPRLIMGLDWDMQAILRGDEKKRGIDSSEGRKKLEVLGFLIRNGARWVPVDSAEIRDCRRSLIRTSSEYTEQLLRWLNRYRACTRETAHELLRPPTLRGVLGKKVAEMDKLTGEMPVKLNPLR